MGAPELASEYFFAEGYTGAGFEEYLTLQNPHGADIIVHATYQLGPGQGGPVSASYTIPAEGRKTVYMNGPEGVGPGVDVSVHLTCAETFLAERPMYFNYSGMGYHAWTGGHCVIGATGSAESGSSPKATPVRASRSGSASRTRGLRPPTSPSPTTPRGEETPSSAPSRR